MPGPVRHVVCCLAVVSAPPRGIAQQTVADNALTGGPQEPREPWSGKAAAVAVAAVSLVVLVAQSPHLLFTATTPTFGDTAAHIYPVAYLRDVLLPAGRVTGWSHDWFGGFPIYYFYFPLPALLIVVLGAVVPFGAAFKLVAAAGPVLLPPSVWFAARQMRFPPAAAALAAVAAGLFAVTAPPYDRDLFGGTVGSAALGEFSYGWGMAFAFAYLGCVTRTVRGVRDRRPGSGRGVALAAVLLAATALSHIICVGMAVIGSAAGLPAAIGRRGRGGWWVTPATWALGFALAAFWALPLLARLSYVGHRTLSELPWRVLVGDPWFWPVLALGLAGAVLTAKTAWVWPLHAVTFFPLVAVFGFDGGMLWAGRVLPFWYCGLGVFAAAAVVWGIDRAAVLFPERVGPAWLWGVAALVCASSAAGSVTRAATGWAWRPLAGYALIGAAAALVVWAATRSTWGTEATLAGGVIFIVLVGALMQWPTATTRAAAWRSGGYESARSPLSDHAAYQAALGILPPGGRILTVGGKSYMAGLVGSPLGWDAAPYWDGPAQVGGLFIESSLSTPYVRATAADFTAEGSSSDDDGGVTAESFDLVVRRAQVLGASHLVVEGDETRRFADSHPQLTAAGERDPWAVYATGAALVEPVSVPHVHAPTTNGGWWATLLGVFTGSRGDGGFSAFAEGWWAEPDGYGQLVAAGGPPWWPRTTPDQPAGSGLPAGAVSDVRLGDHQITFTTSAVGTPHVVRVSYFPNWAAEGADGPWRTTPRSWWSSPPNPT